MKRILIVLLSLILSAGLQQYSIAMPADLTKLNDINISASVDNTKIEFTFDGKPRQEKIFYYDDFVQIEFPDTYTDPPKQWHKVEDDIIKNIFVYQFDTTTLRVRLFSYGKAGSLKSRIKISRGNNGLMILYTQGAAAGREIQAASKQELKKNSINKVKDGPPVEVNVPGTTDAVLPSHASESSIDGQGMTNKSEPAMNRSLDKHPPLQGEGQSLPPKFLSGGGDGLSPDDVHPGKSSETTLSGKQDKGENKLDLADNTPGFTGSVVKMVTALGIVLSLLFGVVYLAKKFLGRKIGLSGQDQKIKVVTSTYLGPKKSIALVEVAGEKIVVGVTATHISMLTRIGKDDDFREVLKEQIKSTDEKVEIQDELWDKV